MWLSYADALKMMLGGTSSLEVETVPLSDADGRVCAANLAAPYSLPREDQSAMDGYAVRTSDFSGVGPFELGLVAESRAGAPGPPLEAAGTCQRIFTGAALPAGADAVVIQENVTSAAGRITTSHRPSVGDHVRRAGADLAKGATILAAETRIHPGHIGIVATCNYPALKAYRRPRVTLVGTGDELRAPGELKPADIGAIAESNVVTLTALAKRFGADARGAPPIADRPEATEARLTDLMAASDVVVTIGGASRGDYDLVAPALERLGCEQTFRGVAIKPGKPVAHYRTPPQASFGSRRGHVLMLPGNPGSATLTFTLFGRPLLARLQGASDVSIQRGPLPVFGRVATARNRVNYLRGRFDDKGRVVVLEGQSSGSSLSFAEAELLIVVDPGRPDHRDGDPLPVIQLAHAWRAGQ